MLSAKKRQLEFLEGGDSLGKAERSIVIEASPKKVWEMLALDRFEEWQVGMLYDECFVHGMEFTSEVRVPKDKYKVGASAQPKKVGEKTLFKVTESLKNEKITYLVEERGTNSTLTSILEPIDKGTKLTYVVGYEMPWGILGKFLAKLFLKRMGEGQLKKSLEKLKSILEQ